MKPINTTILSALLLLVVLVNCSSNSGRSEDKPNIVNESSEELTEDTNRSRVRDTLRVTTQEVDNVFASETCEEMFAKLKASNIKLTERDTENPHTLLKDRIYTFETEGVKYDFLEVNDKSRVFLLYASGKWSEQEVNALTGMKDRIQEILNSAQYEGGKEPDVVCYSNFEEFTYIFVTYEGGEVDRYEYVSWVD